MNLNQRLVLAGYETGYNPNGWFESFQVGTPVTNGRPPGLKDMKRTDRLRKQTNPATARTGWEKGASRKSRKKAKKAMREIVRKTLNQGRHTLVRHSWGSDPFTWNPSTIA